MGGYGEVECSHSPDWLTKPWEIDGLLNKVAGLQGNATSGILPWKSAMNIQYTKQVTVCEQFIVPISALMVPEMRL